MKKLAIALSAVFTLLLSACAPTQTSRSTGQALDDAAITTRVKTEIAKSGGVGSAAAVKVDTYRGVVILAGFVDSDQQKRDAGQAAVGVPGVEKVFNNIQVKGK